jgi:poly-gamma-glutamate capsule biosynthesis protein CapA/YwtB (metallophosphatase superfamily)
LTVRLFLSAVSAAAFVIAAPAQSQTLSTTLQSTVVPGNPVKGSFTLAAVGDLIYLRPMLSTIERRSPDMLRILRSADFTAGNLETTIFDPRAFKGSPQAESGGTWMLADPKVIGDLKAMGFDLVTNANNHATDWGVEGLATTLDLLDAAGLVHAGAGTTASAARQPAYVDMPFGRVGAVAATSTYTPMSRASDALGAVNGRPGVNAIRTQQIGLVNPDDLAMLRRLTGNKGDKPVALGDLQFHASPAAPSPMQIDYSADKRDIAANLLAVRLAKENGNFVLFSVHNHEAGSKLDVPADFAVALAHQVIDAGADVVIGHGPHVLRGIEIFKGKPIFYSLGNFAMMNNSLDAGPSDIFDRFDVDPRTTTLPELLTARNAQEFAGTEFFESAIAVTCFNDGQLAEIRLYPLDLGTRSSGGDRGVPAMADAVVGQRILERLQKLSEPFGTKISIEGNIGFIRLTGAARCARAFSTPKRPAS